MPGALPAEVVQKYNECSTPGQKAVVVNAMVPKTATYRDEVDPSKLDLRVFRKVFHHQQAIKKMTGVTYTELQQKWGGEEKGSAAIQRALDRGDVAEKGGLFYLRTHEVEEKALRSRESSGSQKASDQEMKAYMSKMFGYKTYVQT